MILRTDNYGPTIKNVQLRVLETGLGVQNAGDVMVTDGEVFGTFVGPAGN